MTRSRASVTIRDVAREAGVSVATVSRYLNQTGPVSQEVAARLERVMAELNYIPRAAARNLATHKTSTIGLLLSDIGGDFFAPLLRGIEDVLAEHGYDLLISSTKRPLRWRGKQLPVGPHNTDGILGFAESLDEEHLRQLVALHFPVVLIHRTPPPDLPIPCVTVENKAAARELTSHLIEVHGRRRILFLQGPPEQEDSHWRELGYREALRDHDIPFDPQLMRRGDFDKDIAYQTMREAVQEGLAFDAVFAGDDESAVGVLLALHELGIAVPETVSVVGFDDQRMAPYLTPPLTTVRAPTEMVGRYAAQRLLEFITQGEVEEQLMLLPTEIVIRRSCGCTPA